MIHGLNRLKIEQIHGSGLNRFIWINLEREPFYL